MGNHIVHGEVAPHGKLALRVTDNSEGDFSVPIVEIACVKDYPGAWAEYRVHDGGYTQLVRRISTPDAMAWTERTRQMFAGLYRDYALGAQNDRCFTQLW